MDLVYGQPLKELLQVSTYFKENTFIIVSNELQEKKAKQSELNPVYLISQKDNFQNSALKGKTIAVLGGSLEANEFAVKIKANFLLQPSDKKQFFDLGLAKKLSDNNTKVVLMFSELLKANSFERHLIWKNYLEIVKYCKKKKTPFFVASGSTDALGIRPLKSREALAILLGLSKEEAANGLLLNSEVKK
jgi:RNase P/RNase MRP subunit p30